MTYVDYEFYISEYGGKFFDAMSAKRWFNMASLQLDQLTFWRLSNAFPEDEGGAYRVKYAVCAVAEALARMERLQIAAEKAAQNSATLSDDGSVTGGVVSSVSAGAESISFKTSASTASESAYGKAATSEAERQALLKGIAVTYLANVKDANGVNLLYAGVM